MLTLQNPYISVLRDGAISCGGSQQAFEDPVIARCGCGVIAAADTLLYISRYKPGCGIAELSALGGSGPVPHELYDSLVIELSRRYFPLLPPVGMNGLTLALGMDLFFRRHGLPLRASWGLGREKLWSGMEEMLRADIPVILSVGPNFPLFWRSYKLAFYGRAADGCGRAAETNAHYVTAIGLDDSWLQISSWGRRYYISRAEYLEFADKYSTRLLSNVLYIRPGK